jgi:hypothetical protein
MKRKMPVRTNRNMVVKGRIPQENHRIKRRYQEKK